MNEYTDPRQISLKDLIRPEIQSQLKTDFDAKIDDSFKVVKKMLPTWDNDILYYEGHQVPPGFSGDIVAHFRAKNGLNALEKDDDDQMFVINNMCRKMIDRYTGQYTDAEKTISVNKASNNPKHRNITLQIKRMFEYYEDHIAGIDEDDYENMWTDYRIPAIEQTNILGLYFTDIDYNPERLVAQGGAIEMNTVSPKDVGIDPDSTKKYFKDANYFVHLKKETISEVKRLCKKAGFDPGDVTPDNEWRENHSVNEDLFVKAQDLHCSVYKIQYRIVFPAKYDMAAHYDVKDRIGNEDSMVNNQEMVYFKALYYKPIGIIHHEINPYKQFTLTPYYNKHSNLRLHPLSDIEFFRVLQDLSNIMDTVQLDNVRQRNKLRLFVAKTLSDEYGIDTITDFIRTGGALEFENADADDIRKQIINFNVEGLGNDLQPLIMKVQQYLMDAGFITDASEGKYPKEALSTKSILSLQAEQRRPTNYKDINYSWAASQEAKLIYKIAATEFEDKHYIQLLDQNTKSDYYIPFNATLGHDEYMDLLERNKITVEKFEEENDVHVIAPMTRNPEEFKFKFRAIINPLDEHDRLNIKVLFKFDSAKDKEQDLNVKWQLYLKGDYPKQMIYDAVGLSDEKEEILKLLSEENQILQLAGELAKRPELMQKLQMMMQQYDMQQEQSGKKPAANQQQQTAAA